MIDMSHDKDKTIIKLGISSTAAELVQILLTTGRTGRRLHSFPFLQAFVN